MKYYERDKTQNYKAAFLGYAGAAIMMGCMILISNPTIPTWKMLLLDAVLFIAIFLFFKRKLWKKGTGKWQKTDNESTAG